MSIEWAAGLFEGEGSIGTRPGRKPESRPMLRLQLASTDEDVVRRFHAVVQCGGVYGPYGPHVGQTKPYWAWSASGHPAAALLDKITPLLGQRRTDRAKEVRALVGV